MSNQLNLIIMEGFLDHQLSGDIEMIDEIQQPDPQVNNNVTQGHDYVIKLQDGTLSKVQFLIGRISRNYRFSVN